MQMPIGDAISATLRLAVTWPYAFMAANNRIATLCCQFPDHQFDVCSGRNRVHIPHVLTENLETLVIQLETCLSVVSDFV